ncbi:MAG TPA: hypothetical protein VMU22_00100 [Rhizomicrobium sp.]|nr:hypothetical protein [Rhizomicrobium sp.]
MKTIIKLASAALLGVAAAAITATSASAWIACNREGECWHVHNRYAYRAEYGVVIHPDNWRWRRHEHFVFHEHEGRGYWHNGIWISF